MPEVAFNGIFGNTRFIRDFLVRQPGQQIPYNLQLTIGKFEVLLELVQVHLVTRHNFLDQEKNEEGFTRGTGRSFEEKTPAAIRRSLGGNQTRLAIQSISIFLESVIQIEDLLRNGDTEGTF